MFRHLIVPLDGSEFAAHALPVGMQLAAAAGASVRVLGVARTDAELAWTYDHVVSDAQRAGVDVADVEVRVDPDPTGLLLAIAADERNVLCLASHLRTEAGRNLAALRRVTRDPPIAASCRRGRAERVDAHGSDPTSSSHSTASRTPSRSSTPERLGASTGQFSAARHGVRTGARRGRRPEPVRAAVGNFVRSRRLSRSNDGTCRRRGSRRRQSGRDPATCSVRLPD